MFITLKNTSRGQAAAGNMEQVAQKNAGPDANNGKMRTLRRPACISCQKKKVRKELCVSYYPVVAAATHLWDS